MENAVTNAEADTKANISTDHYPVIADIKAKYKKSTERPQYGKT